MKRLSIFVVLIILATKNSFPQTVRDRIKERREGQTGSNETNNLVPPDYNLLYFWAAHPFKWDYSDNIPSFLKNETRDSSVDVFFLHPTTYTQDFRNAGMNADVNDRDLNEETDQKTILYQATVFNGSCRVFAPRYRQAHLKAFFQYKSAQSQQAFDLAYEDLKTAFQFYLDHWNKGRPIIIASHSQGSMHAIRLLQDFFDGKPLQKQLVCAYVVGWQIKKDDLKNIPFGTSPSQTGCIVGWRTYKKDHEDQLVKREEGNSLCVNPISWKTDNDRTSKKMHKGAVGVDFDNLVSQKISAGIAPGLNVLWVEIPAEIEQGPGLASKLGNFHIADYNLFWMDIRENVRQRINAYFKK